MQAKKNNGVFELIDEKSTDGQLNYWSENRKCLANELLNADFNDPNYEQLNRDYNNAANKVQQIVNRQYRKPVNIGETYKAQMFNK